LFLHIGDSQIIPLKDIIGIFSLKNHDLESNKQFLEYALQKNRINKQEIKEYKSFVVTTDHVYFSPISSQTLGKRQVK